LSRQNLSAHNLTLRACTVKALRSFRFEKLFNSCVEIFVENGFETRFSPEKHRGRCGLHKDEAIVIWMVNRFLSLFLFQN